MDRVHNCGRYPPMVPTYRLLNGRGIPLETFAAADDVEARVCGRELADSLIYSDPRVTGRRIDFTVQRQDGGGWVFVSAWVPRPRNEPA